MNMTAMQVLERDFDAEMAHRGSKSAVERLVMREQECKKHIARYTQIKVDMMNISLPEIIVWPDGKVETKYNWTPEQEKTLALVDEAIERIIKSYGFTTA